MKTKPRCESPLPPPQLPRWYGQGPHGQAGGNATRKLCRAKGQKQNPPEIRWQNLVHYIKLTIFKLNHISIKYAQNATDDHGRRARRWQNVGPAVARLYVEAGPSLPTYEAPNVASKPPHGKVLVTGRCVYLLVSFNACNFHLSLDSLSPSESPELKNPFQALL